MVVTGEEATSAQPVKLSPVPSETCSEAVAADLVVPFLKVASK